MLLIADTSPIISLLLIKQFDLINRLFPDFLIPKAVWDELNNHQEIRVYQEELNFLSQKIKTVSYHYPISGIERGETEAIILYRELDADYLLIDDKKAREKAELFNIKCIGTIGIIFLAKQKGIIKQLRPLFEELLIKNRYYAKNFLNSFLTETQEEPL